jgi:hypothetical protein
MAKRWMRAGLKRSRNSWNFIDCRRDPFWSSTMGSPCIGMNGHNDRSQKATASNSFASSLVDEEIVLPERSTIDFRIDH